MVLTQGGGRDLGVLTPAAPRAYARERKEYMCEIQGHLIEPYLRLEQKQPCCRVPCCWTYHRGRRSLLFVAKACQVVKACAVEEWSVLGQRPTGSSGPGDSGGFTQHCRSEARAHVWAREDAP